ncbi:hypothetical protein, partial [Acinetobacter baumannii]
MTKIIATLGLAAIVSLSVAAFPGGKENKKQEKNTTPHPM